MDSILGCDLYYSNNKGKLSWGQRRGLGEERSEIPGPMDLYHKVTIIIIRRRRKFKKKSLGLCVEKLVFLNHEVGRTSHLFSLGPILSLSF